METDKCENNFGLGWLFDTKNNNLINNYWVDDDNYEEKCILSNYETH